MSNKLTLDPRLDLIFERETKLKPSELWQGWTHPETLMKWFCPRPWRVSECRIDLEPGGEFYTVMEGPQAERVENHGCFLQVIENKKLVWTGILTKGFRPVPADPMGFGFVATIEFFPNGNGTIYRATIAHTDEQGRLKHEQMGFHEGWGLALKQLESLFDLH